MDLARTYRTDQARQGTTTRLHRRPCGTCVAGDGSPGDRDVDHSLRAGASYRERLLHEKSRHVDAPSTWPGMSQVCGYASSVSTPHMTSSHPRTRIAYGNRTPDNSRSASRLQMPIAPRCPLHRGLSMLAWRTMHLCPRVVRLGSRLGSDLSRSGDGSLPGRTRTGRELIRGAGESRSTAPRGRACRIGRASLSASAGCRERHGEFPGCTQCRAGSSKTADRRRMRRTHIWRLVASTAM